MSFLTIVCINYKNVTYMNQGQNLVSLVHQPGTQPCVPGSSTRDTRLCPWLYVVQTNLSPHILPELGIQTCIPSCVIIEKDMIFKLTIGIA